MPKNTRDFSIRMQNALYDKLLAAANAEQRSVSNFVNVVLAAHLADRESNGTVLPADSPTPTKPGRKPKA